MVERETSSSFDSPPLTRLEQSIPLHQDNESESNSSFTSVKDKDDPRSRDGPLQPGEMTPPPIRASLGKPRLLATSKIVLPKDNPSEGDTEKEESKIEDTLDLEDLLRFIKPQV